MYHLHPSAALNKAFSLKPFQGVEPERSKFLFIGLDANYDPNIETSPIFPQVLLYLNNGVEFWKQYGVHHPFMLPTYRGEGKYYHEWFAKIGFRPEDAAEVCFFDLLHVPTCSQKKVKGQEVDGHNKLESQDLDAHHLERLNKAILYGRAQYVFISGGVARLMRASGKFVWMPQKRQSIGQPLEVWHRTQNKTIYWHYHFSVYRKKFLERKINQINAIRDLI